MHLMANELHGDWVMAFWARGMLDLEAYLAKVATFQELYGT
jgi:hypothetical protein